MSAYLIRCTMEVADTQLDGTGIHRVWVGVAPELLDLEIAPGLTEPGLEIPGLPRPLAVDVAGARVLVGFGRTWTLVELDELPDTIAGNLRLEVQELAPAAQERITPAQPETPPAPAPTVPAKSEAADPVEAAAAENPTDPEADNAADPEIDPDPVEAEIDLNGDPRRIELMGKSNEELRELLRERELTVRGAKDEIVERLLEALDSEEASA